MEQLRWNNRYGAGPVAGAQSLAMASSRARATIVAARARFDRARFDRARFDRLSSESRKARRMSATTRPLSGAALRGVRAMESSLRLPTANAVLDVPAGLMSEQRAVLAGRARRQGDAPVSFTTVIGYAVVIACAQVPEANQGFGRGDDHPGEVNVGLLVDVRRPGGDRSVRVPSVKGADRMGFADFCAGCRDIVRRARSFELSPSDSLGTTISITNPGGIGTTMSYPRLMNGQSVLVGVGAIGYPAAFAGADPEALRRIGAQPIVTISVTYDIRVVSETRALEFLGAISASLTDAEFYARLARSTSAG
jgi:multifunctional 2-oxoglutarate metabolism enzyme